MVSLTCTATRTDGVTLVTGRIENPDGPRRVRVENCLDGPVWPPREAGVPAAGWDGDGLTVVVAADGTRPVGYATPADPAAEPMRVTETTAVAAEEDGFEPRVDVPAVDTTAEAVVRALGSPRPPRDAVALPDVAGGERDAAGALAEEGTSGDASGGQGATALFSAVERRLELAERVSGETPLSAAAAAVAEAGGLDGLAALAAQLEADAERLRELERRAGALAARAENADVPTETVARLR